MNLKAKRQKYEIKIAKLRLIFIIKGIIKTS